MKKLVCKIALAFILTGLTAFDMSAKGHKDVDPSQYYKYLQGDWFAQIDIPQNELTMLMEINFLDKENCVIKCRWSGKYPTEEESGKAKYRIEGNRLVITFLNEKEIIRTDHIFDKENIYDIRVSKNKFVILKNRQFRYVDIYFGKGYDNRGFSEIIFPD